MVLVFPKTKCIAHLCTDTETPTVKQSPVYYTMQSTGKIAWTRVWSRFRDMV